MSEVVTMHGQLDWVLEEERKKNGPAEAATSPSHGSHNPTKDQNMDDAITEPGGPASPFRGYHDAFQRLETPIDRVLGFARVQALLNEVCTETTGSYLREEVVEIMSFLAEETLAATKALEGQFLASHNAGCDAQHSEVGR